MSTQFERVRISYKQHSDTGLLCAFSDDLKGLIVFGRTPSQLYEKIPAACSDLVHAISGERRCYAWASDSNNASDKFVDPKADLGDLVPA